MAAEAPRPLAVRTTLHDALRDPSAHPAVRRVASPAPVRWVAAALSALFPLLLVLLLVLPWQQSALGVGRVIAYAPQDRQQAVESPTSGRIAQWFVQEGQAVREGDPLVEVLDNDPDLLTRLSLGLDNAEQQVVTLEQQVDAYEAKLTAESAGRDLAVAEADAKVRGLEQKRVGELAEAEIEAVHAARLETLAAEGIAARRDAEVARMKRDKARAALEARDREIDAQRQYLAKVRADGDAKVASVRAELEAARAKLADALQKLLEVESKVARQEAQLVRAPRDGTVLRLHGGPGGGQVKAGDVLATLVPTSGAQAVELTIDGNDLPLIREGETVRLLFEGWPALQVVGFPGADAGTFAGRVAFVDATDDGKGRFRIVVLPEEDGEWPDPVRLRQGVRVKGWVLLGRVRLGYELWRRLNGFPPLPSIDKGDGPPLPSGKKPRAPSELK